MMKINRYTILSLLVLLLGTSSLEAQRLSIQTRIDKTEMKTGEQAAISVIIRTDDLAGTQYYLLPDSTGRGYPFKVLEFAAIDTIDIDERLKELTARLLITSFDSTLITIPPIVAETATHRELSRPLALKIIQPEVDLSDPTQIEDIKAPWDEELTFADLMSLIFQSPVTWAIGGLLLALLVAWLIYREIKRRQALPPAEPKRILSPLEQALEALKALEREGYATRGLYKEHFTRLTDILRLYIEQRQAMPAMEMTSYELLVLHRERGLTSALYRQLEEILRQADLVKFAKYSPEQEDASEALETVRVFVRAYDLNEEENIRRNTEQ